MIDLSKFKRVYISTWESLDSNALINAGYDVSILHAIDYWDILDD